MGEKKTRDEVSQVRFQCLSRFISSPRVFMSSILIFPDKPFYSRSTLWNKEGPESDSKQGWTSTVTATSGKVERDRSRGLSSHAMTSAKHNYTLLLGNIWNDLEAILLWQPECRHLFFLIIASTFGHEPVALLIFFGDTYTDISIVSSLLTSFRVFNSLHTNSDHYLTSPHHYH